MGTKMPPSYANIFMGRLECNLGLLLRAPFKPLSWLRFIDDIEMKWVENRLDCLKYFITFVNFFHNSMKFTVDISSSKNELYITSTLEDGEIKL